MKKIYIAFALCLATALVFAGCNGSGGDKAATSSGPKDNLIVIDSGEPASLDPALTNDSASSSIMKQVYSTLFDQDYQTLEVVPSLAERYQFENDASGQPTLLRLFLKEGVKFHNGETFTANDVKFTLERAVASENVGEIVEAISKVDVVGDYEVLITLRSPFAPILNHLAHTGISMTNEKAVTEGGEGYARNPIGTGPMRFVRWVAGDRIELTRWDEYYGDAPRIKDVTVRYISDPTTASLELETGRADILLLVQPQDIKRVEGDPNLKLIRGRSLSLNYVGFNFKKPPFDNVLVRQAIMHAIDRQSIVDSVYQGVGAIAKGPLGTMVFASAANDLPQYEYDVEKAKALLAEAGYPDGFETTISYNTENSQRKDTALIMQNMLAQIGITAKPEPVEWAAYLDMTAKGDHNMFMLGWVTITADPDYGLFNVFHSRAFGTAGNRTFYSNPEVDALLEAGRVETDSAAREEIYAKAQQLIHADAPWIYTLEGEDVVGTRANVRGFELNPAGHHPLFNVWFE